MSPEIEDVMRRLDDARRRLYLARGDFNSGPAEGWTEIVATAAARERDMRHFTLRRDDHGRRIAEARTVRNTQVEIVRVMPNQLVLDTALICAVETELAQAHVDALTVELDRRRRYESLPTHRTVNLAPHVAEVIRAAVADVRSCSSRPHEAGARATNWIEHELAPLLPLINQ